MKHRSYAWISIVPKGHRNIFMFSCFHSFIALAQNGFVPIGTNPFLVSAHDDGQEGQRRIAVVGDAVGVAAGAVFRIAGAQQIVLTVLGHGGLAGEDDVGLSLLLVGMDADGAAGGQGPV